MGSDFVIVIEGFEHLGDEPGEPYWGPVFRGDDHEYTFDCPGVNTSQKAVLFCKTLGGDNQNRLTLNGSDVGWLFYSGSGRKDFRTHIRLIDEGILVETGNNLLIEAVNDDGKTRSEGGGGNLDDFVIAEMVIFYKTVPTRTRWTLRWWR